jgi:hypothetical protein
MARTGANHRSYLEYTIAICNHYFFFNFFTAAGWRGTFSQGVDTGQKKVFLSL